MSNSLREKLLGLGFKAPEPEPRPARPERPANAPAADRSRDRRDGRPPRDGKPDARRDGKPDVRRDGQPGPRRDRNGAPAGDRKPGDAAAGAPRPAGAPARSGRPANRGGQRPAGGGKPRSREDIDLAKAYAIRAQREKDERIAAEAARQEEARLRREAKAKLAEFIKDKSLNDPAAEIARHFPYGGKIKRIHVTEAQLKALNAGEFGVLQLDGRYLLVTAAVLTEAEAIFAPAVALRVDPDAPAGDDPYADPLYQVPDDLVW